MQELDESFQRVKIDLAFVKNTDYNHLRVTNIDDDLSIRTLSKLSSSKTLQQYQSLH